MFSLYYSTEVTPPVQLQQIPLYYSMNTPGLVQAATAVGQPQNIMMPPPSSSVGSTTSNLSALHYAGVYTGKFR